MTLCGASASSSFALNSSSASSAHKSGLPPVSDGQRRTAASCVAPKKPAVVRIGMQVTTCRNRRHESAGGMMRDASQTAHFWGSRLGARSRVDRVVWGTFILVAPDLLVLVEFLLLLILDVLIIGLIGDDPTLRLFGQPFAICNSEVGAHPSIIHGACVRAEYAAILRRASPCLVCLSAQCPTTHSPRIFRSSGRDPFWPRPSPMSSFRGHPPRTPRERPCRVSYPGPRGQRQNRPCSSSQPEPATECSA